MMKFNDFQKYQATLLIPYEKYFELIYETKYLLEARLSTDRNFIAQKSFYGCNRRSVVEKVSEWYNKNLRSVLGHPLETLTIDDPLKEVSYDEEFVCTDLRNKYLDNQTIDRLVKEGDGDLGREERKGNTGVTITCIRRLKKRRKKEVQLTDCLVQTPGGTINFKMTGMVRGKSGKGKVKKVKLASKSLDKAKKEVARRGLNNFENFTTARAPETFEEIVVNKAA